MKILLIIIMHFSVGFGVFVADSFISARGDSEPLPLPSWMLLWPFILFGLGLYAAGDGLTNLGNKIFDCIKEDVK